MAKEIIDLTVLIPFYNEEGNVLPVIEEIHSALEGVMNFEIVCVNDCSTDSTDKELSEALQIWPKTVRKFSHERRCGKSAAIFTGLRSVTGAWIQLLDGDGQNDPADTARVWKNIIAKGVSPKLGLVSGRRSSRNDSGFKWLQSRVANGVRRFLLKDNVTDSGCGWKLIRSDVLNDLPYFASMHRFLPALVKRCGWDIREEIVADRKRQHGKSKYGFIDRLFASVFDILGVFWLMRRGKHGIAVEWNDPRSQKRVGEQETR